MMQNSALSFSVVIDADEEKLPKLIKQLQTQYKVKYNEGCELVTIRHYTEEIISKIITGEVLLTQKSRHTARFVTRSKK